MNTHSLIRDLITGLFFTAGILSVIVDQFILSTSLFGMASLASNVRQAKPQRIDLSVPPRC